MDAIKKLVPILLIAMIVMAQKCEKQPPMPVDNVETPTSPTADDTITFDEGIQGKLGSKIANIIQSADAVSAYRLDPEAGLDSTNQELRGVLVIGESGTLTSDQLMDLKLQLGQDSLYSFSSSMNMCFFLPDYGISFTKGDSEQVDILMSLHCNEFRFYESDTLISVDCKSSAAKVHDYISKAFKN